MRILFTNVLKDPNSGLTNMQPNEKTFVGHIFERETKREKNLDKIRQEGRQQRIRDDNSPIRKRV